MKDIHEVSETKIQHLPFVFLWQTCHEMKDPVSFYSLTHTALLPCRQTHNIQNCWGYAAKSAESLGRKSNILGICTVPIAVTAAETDFKVVDTTSYPCIPIFGTSSKNSKCQLFLLAIKTVHRIASSSKVSK